MESLWAFPKVRERASDTAGPEFCPWTPCPMPVPPRHTPLIIHAGLPRAAHLKDTLAALWAFPFPWLMKSEMSYR